MTNKTASVMSGATNECKPTEPIQDTGDSSLYALLNLEGDVRAIEAIPELAYFIANDTRKLVHYRQAVILSRALNGKMRVEAISSLAMVDRTSPFVVWMESFIARLATTVPLDKPREFSLRGYTEGKEPAVDEYPFHEALWLPFKNNHDGVFAGMLLLQERPWEEQHAVIARRLAGTYEHAWSALRSTRSGATRRKMLTSKRTALICLIVTATMFLPVSMTTLAPVEIVASNPQIVAAPLQAVIEEILVDPNSQVSKGDVLFRFNDTDLRNRFSIASQDVQVASVKLRKSKQSAFSSAEQSHDISILKSELTRSQLELSYAKEQLDQVEVRATQDGIILYSDRNEWMGRPVSIGEQVMRLADPTAIEFGVNVPVKDSIVLQTGARVRVYLDADPVTPVEAVLSSASYHATELPGQQLAYRSRAQMKGDNPEKLRIGLRGTAKVYGEKVSLFFYLFRRPISATRQFLGV